MSPPLTMASNMYGLFCSSPAARGETASMAMISPILPSALSASLVASPSPLPPPPPIPLAIDRGIPLAIDLGISSAYTSNSACSPSWSLEYPLIPRTSAGGVARTVPRLTSCFPAFGALSRSSMLTTLTHPALKPQWARILGWSESDSGHALIRASMLLARPLGE